MNIADIVGIISGKKLLLAYYRRFQSLMNIFIREKGIGSVLESSGLVQTPYSELILALYDQCRSQISQDIQNEKGRYTEAGEMELAMMWTDAILGDPMKIYTEDEHSHNALQVILFTSKGECVGVGKN